MHATSKIPSANTLMITLGQPYFEEPKTEEEPPIPTLEKYFEGFRREYLDTATRETTRISYEGSFRIHILPKFGELRLDQLTRARVKKFVAALVKDGLSKATIRIITAELSSVLNSAIEDGIISKNPASRLTKFYKQAPIIHDEIQPLTHDEVPQFLQSVIKYSPEHYPLFLCAIHTGIRSGEQAALKWPDVDFHGKFLIIRKNIVRGRYDRTKTDRIHRVDISDALLAELNALRRKRREEYLAAGKNEIPEWVQRKG